MISDAILAERTKHMGASIIREILKVASQPGVVSLAGGLPAPEAFPLELMGELTHRVIEKYRSQAFQYDRTEGFLPLREQLAGYLSSLGIKTTAAQLLICSGSQGALDGFGKIFISEQDEIAVEAPTYLGAIQAFNTYGPRYVEMETDDQGLIPASMEEVIKKHNVKFVYLVPTFQNPTGRTIPLERREKIAQLAKQYNVLIVEDDPYGALRYRGDFIPPIKSFAPDHVAYLGTFSKTFAPGLRLGFCVAPELVRNWMVLAKQGVDLHTSSFNQALAAEYLAGGFLQQQITKIINLYKPKQEAMLEALEAYFPRSFHWTKPDGGMFIWAEGPKGLDIMSIYEEALENKVAFVPGRYFYTDNTQGMATMRLNYTAADEAAIREAVKKLGGVIKRKL